MSYTVPVCPNHYVSFFYSQSFWTNRDSVRHTVTSDSGNELDSELLSQSGSYSHTFAQTGTYDYHCKPHPYMTGTIIVE